MLAQSAPGRNPQPPTNVHGKDRGLRRGNGEGKNGTEALAGTLHP
jgi:hypothetical protein